MWSATQEQVIVTCDVTNALSCLQVVPSEVQCNGCHAKVLKVTEKMIKVIREQTGQGDIDPTDTGRNILAVLSNYVQQNSYSA